MLKYFQFLQFQRKNEAKTTKIKPNWRSQEALSIKHFYDSLTLDRIARLVNDKKYFYCVNRDSLFALDMNCLQSQLRQKWLIFAKKNWPRITPWIEPTTFLYEASMMTTAQLAWTTIFWFVWLQILHLANGDIK